jgi:hypothetical protein
MAYPAYFKDESGSNIIAVSDGDYYTDRINIDYNIGQCAVEFLDAQEQPVTPTGGTVSFLSAPIGEQWHQPSNGNGVINAADVVAGEASYTMPQFNGPVIKSKMTLSGVTGAAFVRAYHWRDE